MKKHKLISLVLLLFILLTACSKQTESYIAPMQLTESEKDLVRILTAGKAVFLGECNIKKDLNELKINLRSHDGTKWKKKETILSINFVDTTDHKHKVFIEYLADDEVGIARLDGISSKFMLRSADDSVPGTTQVVLNEKVVLEKGKPVILMVAFKYHGDDEMTWFPVGSDSYSVIEERMKEHPDTEIFVWELVVE